MSDNNYILRMYSDLKLSRNEYLKNPDNIDLAEKYIDELFGMVLEEGIKGEVALPEMEKVIKQFPFSERIAEAYSYTLVPYDLTGEIAKNA